MTLPQKCGSEGGTFVIDIGLIANCTWRVLNESSPVHRRSSGDFVLVWVPGVSDTAHDDVQGRWRNAHNSGRNDHGDLLWPYHYQGLCAYDRSILHGPNLVGVTVGLGVNLLLQSVRGLLTSAKPEI